MSNHWKWIKKWTGGFLGLLLGILGASLLGNMLACKGFIRAGDGVTATSPEGWGTIRSGKDF